jgi:hypothetical protein
MRPTLLLLPLFVALGVQASSSAAANVQTIDPRKHRSTPAMIYKR